METEWRAARLFGLCMVMTPSDSISEITRLRGEAPSQD